MKKSKKSITADKAKELLRAALGGAVKLRWHNTKRGDFAAGLVADAVREKEKRALFVEIRSCGEPRVITELVGKIGLSPFDGYAVLAAPFVSERGRAMCMDAGLGFIDLAGNAYLKFGGILIDRYGKENTVRERKISKSLFFGKSSYVIREMLSGGAAPQIAPEWTLRKLADASGVSIRKAFQVMERLEAQGYAKRSRGANKLTDPRGLLEAWAKTYDFSAQKAVGYFCPLKEQGTILSALRDAPASSYALTLGAAASLIAPAVRSTDVYIYAPGDPKSIIDALGLRPVEFGGNVYIVEPADAGVLFDTQQKDGVTLVSNLQLYLDLYNYPARGREQAEAIRDKAFGELR